MILPTAAMVRNAWRIVAAQFPLPQLLLLGWLGVWVLTELLVFGFSPLPGHPLWIIFHAGYFWGAAYFEYALLALALGEIRGTPANWRACFADQAGVFKLFLVKLLLLPVMLLGFALFLVPGLLVAVRLGPAAFLVMEKRRGPLQALRDSANLTRGHTLPLLVVGFAIFLLNVLGAALLGLGLFITLPITVVVFADIYVKITETNDVAA